MSTSAHAPLETEVPVFNVVVSMLPDSTLESVEQLARRFGELSNGQIEGLIRALQNGPRVKIGDHVTKERADVAKEQFSKLGLAVTVVPMLSLQAKSEGDVDGRFLCRACNNRVDLPANRQCPSCDMFVDKITDEWLLRRKIMEQERAKLDSQINREDKEMKKRSQKSIEDAIREKIREELEEEYGLNKKNAGLFQGKTGLIRAGGLLGLLAVAFLGGNMVSSGGLPFGKPDSKVSASTDPAKADVDKMLNNVGVAGSAGSATGGGDAQTATAGGDPDMDDPMIQELAGGKKMGGPGLTIEQAVAASKTLAASVGNHTADRAMDGTLPGGSGKPGVAGAGNTSDSAVADAASAAVIEPVAAVPLVTKQLLAADLSKQLAQLGQHRRAREVVKHMKPLATEPAAIAALQGADLEAQAWAMQPMSGARARQAIDLLIDDSKLISDPVERSKALAQAGVIVSQHAQLPADAARALLTLAAESLKSVPDAKGRTAAMGDWMVAMGQVFLNEATNFAKSGRLAKAQGVSDHLNGLLKDAPDATAQARIYAIQYQMKLRTAQADKAEKSLETAIALVGKVNNLVEQSILLQSVVKMAGGVASPQIQGAITALRSQLDAKAVLNKEQAYAHISLLYGEFGVRDKAGEYGRLAHNSKGLTPAESSVFSSELIVRSELATAKSLHDAGQYPEAETILQRVSGFLL